MLAPPCRFVFRTDESSSRVNIAEETAGFAKTGVPPWQTEQMEIVPLRRVKSTTVANPLCRDVEALKSRSISEISKIERIQARVKSCSISVKVESSFSRTFDERREKEYRSNCNYRITVETRSELGSECAKESVGKLAREKRRDVSSAKKVADDADNRRSGEMGV